MSEFDYVKSETAKTYTTETGNSDKMTLLWGDRVRVFERGPQRTKIKARLRRGYSWIGNDDLGGKPLLELYFIDVGQGDGTLIVTPGRRHLLVDGGWTRDYQPTGKNAADFVDWKFYEDYGENEIRLDCMIASHCDADHYGGFIQGTGYGQIQLGAMSKLRELNGYSDPPDYRPPAGEKSRFCRNEQ